ncbi:hypothetical protein BKA69DRAFT_1043950 [Paraphysoderma sedebokerense]|nr:hypothetical protein BKA69DRAFT_1043950 [Paraphysoderma sedebokerense]
MSLTYQPPTYPMYTVSAVDSIISSIHHVLHNQSTFPFDTTDFLSTLITAISNSPVIFQCLFDRFFELLYMNSNSEESAFPSIRLYVTIGFVLGLILKNESHAPYIPVVFQSSTSSVIKYEKFGSALLYPYLNWPIETLQAYRPKSTWVVGFMCVMTSLLSHQYSERPMASLFDENFEHRLHYVSLYIHTKSAGESVRCAINSFDKALEIAIDLNLIKSLENVDLTQAWLRWGDFGEKEILRHIAKSTSKIRTLREALGYSLESAVYLFKQSPVVSKEGIPARFRLVADAIIANSAEEDRALLYPTWIWDVMEGSAEAKVEDLLEFIAALEPEYLLVGGCQHRMPMEDLWGRCRTVSSRFISNKDNFLTVVNIIMRCLIWDWKHSESGEAYFKNCLLSLPALSPFMIREWNRLCGPNSGEILDWLTTAFRKINDGACVLGYEFIAEAFVMEHSIFKINYENTIIPSLEELVSHCSILKSKMPDFIDASYQISMKMYLKLVEPYLREVDPFVAILSSNNSLIHSTRQTLLTIISHHPELSIRLSDISFLRVPLISILHPYENVMTSRQQTLAVWTIISQMNPTTLTKVFQKNGQLSWEIITTMAVIVFGKGDEVVVGTSSPRDEHPMSLTTREQILDVLMICDSIGEELEMDDSTIVAYKKFKLFFRHQLEGGDFLG